MLILQRFLCSCSFLVVPPYRYLVRRGGGSERNQALLSTRPHGASPHQTKRARPRRTSLGIFNTAGYEVLIALFLTSQIPFSISLFPPRPPSFHSFFVSLFKLPVSLSQFSFLLCRSAPLYCLSLSILKLSVPVPLFYFLCVFVHLLLRVT